MVDRYRNSVVKAFRIAILSDVGVARLEAQAFPSNPDLADQNVVLSTTVSRFGSGVSKECGNGKGILAYRAAGSGCIVDKNGTIVTNYRVINRALSTQAAFDVMASRGGATYQVPVIKVYDRQNDIVVLQIQGAASCQATKLGSSNSVEPRDDELAVDNPMSTGLNMAEGKTSQVRSDECSLFPTTLVDTAAATSRNSGGSLYQG